MTFKAEVTLPWPHKDLSPNTRKDRRYTTATRARAKYDAFYACVEIGAKNLRWPAAHVDLTFCPPDRRRRDLDNMLASNKSALDGIAAATGIDDSLWTISMRRGEPRKHGCVIVSLSPITSDAGV